MSRISLVEAMERTLAAEGALESEALDATQGAGRVLAEDITYPTDLPAFAHAAMDGYAIAAGATQGTRLEVRGESRAGAPSLDPATHGAVAISTGAAMPAGTTTVIPWEDVERSDTHIVVRRAARDGQHVRAAGEDVRKGTRALGVGTRLGPRHIAVAAMADRAIVRVARRPRVALLSTGDELVRAGTPRREGQIIDSNGPMVAALAAQAGASVTRAHVLDREGALEAAIEAARATSDVIVTIGGAADGDHDHVVRALAALGAEWIFRGVAIKPGKPVGLARAGALHILALPGNPGSAYVTFALLGIPLLRAMQGDSSARPAFVSARLSRALRASPDRLGLVYGGLDESGLERMFHPGPHAPSGSVPALSSAAALGLVPRATELAAGDSIEVAVIDRL